MSNYKMHLATGEAHPPLDAFFEGTFKEWQEGQSRKNFECEMIVGLIEYKRHKWLFAGVYRVLGREPHGDGGIRYRTTLIKGQNDLVGRIIVDHKRKGRAAYLWGLEDGGEFYISEIRERPLTIEDFPGYNAVTVSFTELRLIINQDIDSWRGALSSVNGVYLITDTKTGKQYVGSALGEEGIWQRWADYAKDGHGGVEELRAVLDIEGSRYAFHFQYSVLEIADTHASEEYILEREAYWKKALKTRKFGYNRN
jgi:hypothetical protein